jgi:hypothetical protein
MEYPFPEPLTLRLGLQDAPFLIAITFAFALSVIPLVRIWRCRRRTRNDDTRAGLIGTLGSAIFGLLLCQTYDDMYADQIKVLGVMVGFALVVNLVWLALRIDPRRPLLACLVETGVPYGSGLVVVLSVLAQTAHHAHPSHVGCLSNLKNISVAISDYATENNGDLPHLTPSVRDVPRSWRVELLPFLRYADVYSRYRFDRAWDSPENLTHAQTFLRAYRCPANPHRFTPDLAGRFYPVITPVRSMSFSPTAPSADCQPISTRSY